MRRETNEFLQLVRDAQDPTPADEERVLSALKATLAAGVTSNAIVAATLARPRAGASVGAIGSKLTVVLACTAAAIFGSGDTRSIGGTSRAPSPTHSAEHTAVQASEKGRPLAPVAPVAEAAPEAIAPVPRDPAPEASAAPREVPTELPARRGAKNPRRTERPGASPLRAELELLQRVQLALREGDGEAALRMLDAHETTDRILLAERAAARILALCSLGRVAEARSLAARFVQEHPESVQRDAIARSCAAF
jgi:RNA polymerase sigma-70 factor (ECF subfamily)